MSATAGHHSDPVSVQTVVGGLNAPRGVTFDGNRNMYVAESGVTGPDPAGLTQSGRVSKYRWHRSTPSWQTGFQSLYVTEDPSAPKDVLGPEGISALGGKCDEHRSCPVMMIMSESEDGIAAASGGALDADQAGLLYRLDRGTGAASRVSDVGNQSFDWTGDHKALFPPDFPDANPYGVLVIRSHHGRVRTFVADAAANTISEITRHGRTRVIAYIPNETAPPFRDATPTCMALGPDGMLYVATLNFVSNLFVNGPWQSNVWRVNPNANYPAAPTLWATGLTTPTACTFDEDGNFWAAEMFQPNTGGTPGDIVRIPFHHPTQLDRIGGGMLPFPGGIAQGPDEAMYVTINSSTAPAGTGAVVRVVTDSDHD
ncbi:MAG: ScyD/ScyE family protein [Jatrophihabitantaceae bacterium]